LIDAADVVEEEAADLEGGKYLENRISKRIPVSFEAHLTWGDKTYRAFITSISEKGLYVIAPSGEKDFTSRDKSSVIVKFFASPGNLLELRCKEIWSDSDITEHSTQTIGLEIKNPPVAFKEFYRASFFRIKKEMSHDAIAVVGMACYYPDAPDLKSFWENWKVEPILKKPIKMSIITN